MTTNSIFHGVTREQANKIRSGHGAFYRYLKGICNLRKDIPKRNLWPINQPPPHLRRETFFVTLGEIADTEEDSFPTEWEGLPLHEFIAITLNPSRTTDPDTTTDNFYRAFCALCREFAREAVIQEKEWGRHPALALLPDYRVQMVVSRLKNLLDQKIFTHYKSTTKSLTNT